MRRVLWVQLLVIIVMIVLFPKVAHAQSGRVEVYATIVLIIQCIAGPVTIYFARYFKGRRLVYLAGYFLGVVCSWVFFLTGRPFGLSAESYDILTENIGLSSWHGQDEAAFFVHFLGFPLAALVAVCAAYALRQKYHEKIQKRHR